jgi:hypothetical protein
MPPRSATIHKRVNTAGVCVAMIRAVIRRDHSFRHDHAGIMARHDPLVRLVSEAINGVDERR